jgi:DNA-binding NtrC family response regulator
MFVLKILVVDDERIVVDVLREIIIQNSGYKCDYCYSGEEALEMIESNEYDVVITDVKLPGIDGIKILEKIKKEKPNIEVILLTGYASMNTAIQAMKYEAYDFLQKPFEPDRILSILDRIRKIKCLSDEPRKSKVGIENYYDQSKITADKVEKERKFLVEKLRKIGEIIEIDGMTDGDKLSKIKKILED